MAANRRPPGTRRSRVAGTRRAENHRQQPSSRNTLRRFSVGPARWFLAILATAISAVLVAILTNLVNVGAVVDSIRRGPDLEVSATRIFEDGVYDSVTPWAYELPATNPLRTGVDVEEALTLASELWDSGAYALGYLRIAIALEGRRDQPVRINDISLSDLQQEPPVAGTLVELNQEGAGGDIQLTYDLSKPFPLAMDATAGATPSAPYFVGHGIELAKEEQLTLKAHFEAPMSSSFTFTLTLHYAVGDRTEAVEITDHGRPFRVSSYNCLEGMPGVASYRRAYIMDVINDGDLALIEQSDPGQLDTSGCP